MLYMNDPEVVPKGKRTRNNEAFELINGVEPGCSVIMLRGDWKMRTIPGMNIIRRRTGREFKVETLKDFSGWKLTAL